MQLMEAASRLFRDRDGAYRGAVANAILDLDSDSAAALAVLLDKQQEDALEAALERRAAAETRAAAERVAAAEGAAAGAAGAAGFRPMQADVGWLLGIKVEWTMEGSIVVQDTKRTAKARLLIDTGCTGVGFDLVIPQHNASRLGLSPHKSLDGSVVKSGASAFGGQRCCMILQAPTVRVVVPLYRAGVDSTARTFREGCNMQVWVREEERSSAPGTSSYGRDSNDGFDGLGDLDALLEVLNGELAIVREGEQQQGQQQQGQQQQGQQQQVQQQLPVLGQGLQSTDGAYQPVSPIEHGKGADAIIGLSGLAKLGLRLDPGKRLVYSVTLSASIVSMASI